MRAHRWLPLVPLVALAFAGQARAELITVQYTATVQTVAGNPFGFDDTIRLTSVTGSFTYDTLTPDSLPGDPGRGNYQHTANGAFSFLLGSFSVTGSATPFVQVENDLGFPPSADTFRFVDGDEPFGSPGVMSVNGVPNSSVGLFIAISDGTTLFPSDALPAMFPTLIPPPPHTFSLGDSGGTLLMQFGSLQQVSPVPIPEPSSLTLCAVGAALTLGWLRQRRRASPVFPDGTRTCPTDRG